MSVPKHFYLISGTVAFYVIDPENPENLEPRSMIVNAIVRQNAKEFPASALARAQRNLQAVCIQKFAEEVRQYLRFQDTIIQNIIHIGHMTEEKFQAQPKELAAVEPVKEVI